MCATRMPLTFALTAWQVVTAWNGMAIGAFAKAARILLHEETPAARCFPVDGCAPSEYLAAATKVGVGSARMSHCSSSSGHA